MGGEWPTISAHYPVAVGEAYSRMRGLRLLFGFVVIFLSGADSAAGPGGAWPTGGGFPTGVSTAPASFPACGRACHEPAEGPVAGTSRTSITKEI